MAGPSDRPLDGTNVLPWVCPGPAANRRPTLPAKVDDTRRVVADRLTAVTKIPARGTAAAPPPEEDDRGPMGRPPPSVSLLKAEGPV